MTLNDLVYSTSYSPHGGDEAGFEIDIIIPGLGSATHIDKPRLRRLYFEAFVHSASELRRAGEGTPTEIARVVPVAGREERRKRVERR